MYSIKKLWPHEQNIPDLTEEDVAWHFEIHEVCLYHRLMKDLDTCDRVMDNLRFKGIYKNGKEIDINRANCARELA